jgi:hypothetical protein
MSHWGQYYMEFNRDNERTNYSSHDETRDELYAEAEIQHIIESTSSVTCIRVCWQVYPSMIGVLDLVKKQIERNVRDAA